MDKKRLKILLIGGWIIFIFTVIIMAYYEKSASHYGYFVLKGIYLISTIALFICLLDLKIKYLNIGWGVLSILVIMVFIDEFNFINISNELDIIMKEALLAAGMICVVYGFYSHIQEKEEALEKLYDLAFRDPLTNIPNRRFIEEQLELAIQRNEKKISLLFMDLDKFKLINDSFGHGVGDELLYQVASRIKGILRETDTIARLGGDEFMIVSYHVKEIEEVEHIIEKVLATFKKAFVLKEKPIHITCSCGISVYPDHGTDIQMLFQKADEAMYQAKKYGSRGYMIYDSCIHKNINNVIEMDKSKRGRLYTKRLYSVKQ